MMQTFILWGQHPAYKGIDTFGGVHCPQLYSLSISKLKGIIYLSNGPMQNVHMDIIYHGGPIYLYLKLLDLLPNLVSLTCAMPQVTF